MAEEPTALISNLFPVKAKGDVLFLSVLSNNISGIFPTKLSFKSDFSFGLNLPFFTFSSSSKTRDNDEPINTEIIAGGASPAPNL